MLKISEIHTFIRVEKVCSPWAGTFLCFRVCPRVDSVFVRVLNLEHILNIDLVVAQFRLRLAPQLVGFISAEVAALC